MKRISNRNSSSFLSIIFFSSNIKYGCFLCTSYKHSCKLYRKDVYVRFFVILISQLFQNSLGKSVFQRDLLIYIQICIIIIIQESLEFLAHNMKIKGSAIVRICGVYLYLQKMKETKFKTVFERSFRNQASFCVSSLKMFFAPFSQRWQISLNNVDDNLIRNQRI